MRRLVHAVLVQDQIAHFSLCVLHKRELRIYRLVEKFRLAGWKDLQESLPCKLREQTVARITDGEKDSGLKLVFAGVSVEFCRVELDGDRLPGQLVGNLLRG